MRPGARRPRWSRSRGWIPGRWRRWRSSRPGSPVPSGLRSRTPSGKPIQGALVTALTAPNPSAGVTDGNGRVTIPDLAAVRVMQVKAYKDGLVYHEVHVTVPTGGRADAEITLPGPSAAGQAPVVSNPSITPSSGAGNAQVTFRMTGTDPQGHSNIAEDQVFALNPDLGNGLCAPFCGRRQLGDDGDPAQPGLGDPHLVLFHRGPPVQYQQHRSGDLHRAVRRALAILLLLAAVPLLALAVGQGEPSPPRRQRPWWTLSWACRWAPLCFRLLTELSPDRWMASWRRPGSKPRPRPCRCTMACTARAGRARWNCARCTTTSASTFWPAGPPRRQAASPDAWRNLLTVHWRLVDPGLVSGESTGSDGLACTVACHTATADGQGQLVGIRNETIPPGLDDDLPAGGGWAQGEWILEWSRPRVSESPYDQHLTDPEQGYRFFVKLFQGLEDRADPVSDVHESEVGPVRRLRTGTNSEHCPLVVVGLLIGGLHGHLWHAVAAPPPEPAHQRPGPGLHRPGGVEYAPGRPFRFSTYLDAAFRLDIPIQEFKEPDMLLGYHVEPILAAIAPLYLLHDGPETLLWLQTIVIALGRHPALL